ncbi:MAG: hypothetical protein FJY17_00790 [Bacteroidetes bacterium]|nr:hypothetical protein [Bacteroidota bacterium]
MVKFNKKKLLDDISKILATLDGKAYDKKWGKHIATSNEVVQYFLVARELKRRYPTKYKNIFIDNLKRVPPVLKSKGHGVKQNDNSSIYKKISTEEQKPLNKIDMLIEYTDFWLLIQFKLLRPMGGKLRRFGEDFFKQFLLVEKFGSGFYPNEDSSIANDILKFDKISQKPVGGKKIKKLVIAIYYPSDNLWPNQKNKVKRLEKKGGEFESKIGDLETELKKCENKIDIDFYKKKLEDIFSPLKYKYKESRPKKIIPMTMKIKPIGEFKRIKPNKSQAKWNFSEFFHIKVKLLSWEIT